MQLHMHKYMHNYDTIMYHNISGYITLRFVMYIGQENPMASYNIQCILSFYIQPLFTINNYALTLGNSILVRSSAIACTIIYR